jgi:hypothetical protein
MEPGQGNTKQHELDEKPLQTELLRDDHALDLVGAFVDLGDPGEGQSA